MFKKVLIYIGIVLLVGTGSFFVGRYYTLRRSRFDDTRIGDYERLITEQSKRIEVVTRGIFTARAEADGIRLEVGEARKEVGEIKQEFKEYRDRIESIEIGVQEDTDRITGVIDRLRYHQERSSSP